jgi:hypothetical protein
VKLIKKCGDTLALRVYTPKIGSVNLNAVNAPATNLISTSATCGVYQAPSVTVSGGSVCSRTSTLDHRPAVVKSNSSYYASSSISTNAVSPHVINTAPDYSPAGEQHTTALNVTIFDGTKSLPGKKKRKCFFLTNH